MKSFSDLLLIISKKIPTETIVRDFLLEYLKKNHTITIDRKCIQVQKNKIVLNVSPIIKSRLTPYKQQVLNELNNYLKEKEIQTSFKNML